MAQFKFIGMIAVVVFLSAFTISTTTSWNINEDHSITFNTKKAKGSFKDFVGEIQFDENNLSDSKFDVRIDVKSIKTGNWLKNRHAKGKKWFDSDQFPTINFTSQSFDKTSTGYEVTGTLEMHGIQKEITMPFTFDKNVFKSSFSVSRIDFGIGATTGMSGKVGHDIQLDIAVPVTK